MAQSMSNFDAALKELYQPGIQEQLNNEIALLANLEKNTRDVEGRRAVLSLHVTRNSGVGARAEGGTLPTAGQQGYAEERVPLKYNYAKGNITGPVIEAAKSDKGSFARALDQETTRIVEDLKRDVNRQAWGSGDGKIATCGTTNNSTTVTLATTTTAVQMRQLEDGMVIDIGTVASPTTAANAVTISSSDHSAKTLVVSSAVTTTSSHFVFRSGSVGVSVCHEVTGIQAIVSSAGTLFNVNPSTYSAWKSYVSTNSGTNRSLTENLMAATLHEIKVRSGKYPNFIACSDGVHRAYAALLTSLKRFPGTTMLKGGYAGLDFAAGGPTIPVVWERDAPANKMFFLNLGDIQEYQSTDWGFIDRDGSVLHWDTTTDSYTFAVRKYHEVACTARNSHGLLGDLLEA